MVLALGLGCGTDTNAEPVNPKTTSNPASDLSAAAVSADSEATVDTAPAATKCADGSPPKTANVNMGPHVLVTRSCTIDGESSMISAHAVGKQWQWSLPNTGQPPDPEDATGHNFQWIGVDAAGHGYMVLRYWACPMDGCESALFYQWKTDGTISQIGATTKADSWSINATGHLQYSVKEGYSAGYSVASADQAFAWSGTAFSPAGPPLAQAEFDTWFCEDTMVEVVDPTTGVRTGKTVAVAQGDTIEALRIGTSKPIGSLFEYRVNGITFWAENWQQTCAG